MDAAKLVKMANDIGAFFEADPDAARAVAGVADHLRRFWDPRMRRAFDRWLDTSGGDGLRPLVLQAVTEQRERLEPAAVAEVTPMASALAAISDK
jgi:formate dehydrogenase subunit delta